MAGPSFHIGILPDRPVAEVADLAQAAEELGFDGIWVADSQSIFRDAFTALAVCAARTSRLALATGVTNPVTRHPAVLAGAFATLDELSCGRAILGIGVGESAVRTLGLEPARLGRLEEVTRVLRGLLAGEEVVFDGDAIRLAWTARSIPIVYASSGPRSLALAGRVADGVLFQAGADPGLVSFALDRIDAGLREAGREGAPFTRHVRLACSVGGDRQKARDELRGYASIAAGTVFANIPRERFRPEVWNDIEHMKARYDYYEHGSSTAAHAALVTDAILDSVAIAGTPAEAIPRFRELLALGVDGFVVPITTSDPVESMRALAEDVIRHL